MSMGPKREVLWLHISYSKTFPQLPVEQSSRFFIKKLCIMRVRNRCVCVV